MNLIGKIIGNRYEILEEAGNGGMSIVYKAKCRMLSRDVAIKILRKKFQYDEDSIKRFYTESQASAMLSHPNIISIYDFGHENGLYYIVLEYIEGTTLKHIINKNKLNLKEVVDFSIQIASALEHAHKKSIIHRDIKPQNIIITKEKIAKVTDFGIARTSNNLGSTVEINTLGSVIYFSPEQARGSYTDEKSDIYSLGVVIYEMATGIIPFNGDSPISIAIKHLQNKPRSPKEYNPEISEFFEKVILKAMAKEQFKRYQNATEIITDLKMIQQNDSAENENAHDSYSKTIEIPNIHIRYNDTRRKLHTIENKTIEKQERNDKNYKTKRRIGIFLGILTSCLTVGLTAFKLLPALGVSFYHFGSNKEVEIPELIGKNISYVAEKYKGTNFKIIKTGTVDSEEEVGTIISQYPEIGKKVKNTVETEINVKLSSGKKEIILTNYAKYRDYREAQVELEALGIKVKIIKENNDKIPINSITKQFPACNAKVIKGDEVVLYVSIGPREIKPKETEKQKPQPEIKKDKEPSEQNIKDNKKEEKIITENEEKSDQKNGIITITSPENKETLITLKVEDKTIYEKTKMPKETFDIKIISENEEVKIDIFFDNIFYEQKIIQMK
ncbi:MAG: Stk1 family PASTA domain-containing Ser/Thr kinase [Clostridiales bacterium]|jgi:serine/threonine-protein kinase|nr:Stk1 family PASTA domain-containing Ser/Thr kinase [Clostridiales bacterium]